MANIIIGVAHTCSCAANGACNCWTPRKPVSRPRRKTDSALSATTAVTPHSMAHAPPAVTPADTAAGLDAHSPTEAPAPRSSSHILARISELRPVLPRPTSHHDPSSGIAHGHPNRHHESAFFSPYGRAYDINHLHHPHTADDGRRFSSGPAPSKPQIYDRAVANSISTDPTVSNASITFPSPCGCGDGCSCPGCFHHNNAPFAPSPTAYPTCSNPAHCNACLDCTILSLPPDTALSIPEPQQAEAIDEWIRQVQANPDSMMMPGMDGQLTGWDNLAQLSAGRRQCATCTSFYCSCERESNDHHESSNEASCCDKPKPADMGSMLISSGQGQGYGSPSFFDYSMLGIQPSNDAFLDTAAIEAFRSRSPSISPNSHHEFPPQLFATLAYSTLVDKMPAPQQSMYINGRGFYSDPYLSMSSNEHVDGFVLDTHTPLLSLPLSNVDYPTGTYAVSNPDSDTSSFDSVDDFAPPPPPPQSKQAAPVEGMRTLY